MEGKISSLRSGLPKIAGHVSFHLQCHIAEIFFSGQHVPSKC